jgi:hypothetical protein
LQGAEVILLTWAAGLIANASHWLRLARDALWRKSATRSRRAAASA